MRFRLLLVAACALFGVLVGLAYHATPRTSFVARDGGSPREALSIATAIPKAESGADFTHRVAQTIPIKATNCDGRLQSLAGTTDGTIFALVGAERFSRPRNDVVCSEIQVFDLAGKRVTQWSLPFHSQAINLNQKGELLVAGSGQVAIYSRDGKLLRQISLAFVHNFLAEPKKVSAQAQARKQNILAMHRRDIKTYERVIAQPDRSADQPSDNSGPASNDGNAEDAEDAEDSESSLSASVMTIGEAMAQLKEARALYAEADDRALQYYIDEVSAFAGNLHSIAGNDQYLYVIASEASGYGYVLWRIDLKSQAEVRLQENMVGCCGILECQASNDHVFVADNVKFSVVTMDRDGKAISKFGRRGREEQFFAGCCNPVNIYCTPTQILTAEAEGVIKRFSSSGKLESRLANLSLTGGCKHVALTTHAPSDTVIISDLEQSQLVYLTPKTSAQ